MLYTYAHTHALHLHLHTHTPARIDIMIPLSTGRLWAPGDSALAFLVELNITPKTIMFESIVFQNHSVAEPLCFETVIHAAMSQKRCV